MAVQLRTLGLLDVVIVTPGEPTGLVVGIIEPSSSSQKGSLEDRLFLPPLILLGALDVVGILEMVGFDVGTREVEGAAEVVGAVVRPLPLLLELIRMALLTVGTNETEGNCDTLGVLDGCTEVEGCGETDGSDEGATD